jgi:hypothetical protein
MFIVYSTQCILTSKETSNCTPYACNQLYMSPYKLYVFSMTRLQPCGAYSSQSFIHNLSPRLVHKFDLICIWMPGTRQYSNPRRLRLLCSFVGTRESPPKIQPAALAILFKRRMCARLGDEEVTSTNVASVWKGSRCPLAVRGDFNRIWRRDAVRFGDATTCPEKKALGKTGTPARTARCQRCSSYHLRE